MYSKYDECVMYPRYDMILGTMNVFYSFKLNNLSLSFQHPLKLKCSCS